MELKQREGEFMREKAIGLHFQLIFVRACVIRLDEFSPTELYCVACV